MVTPYNSKKINNSFLSIVSIFTTAVHQWIKAVSLITGVNTITCLTRMCSSALLEWTKWVGHQINTSDIIKILNFGRKICSNSTVANTIKAWETSTRIIKTSSHTFTRTWCISSHICRSSTFISTRSDHFRSHTIWTSKYTTWTSTLQHRIATKARCSSSLVRTKAMRQASTFPTDLTAL